MKTKFFLVSLSFFIGMVSWGQKTTKASDSIDLSGMHYLDQVVLTGQYNPQSVDEAVFEVDVISREEIKRMAGNTLADVLTQTLNLNVIPDASTGRSGIEQFGFNSQYVKILVDGIPLVGDEGFGNAIDISQINLDDIKQIEIVEGAMGVQYGANAVTGVINIITKKRSRYDWQITPYLQEETIGDEYGLFDAGRHIQSIKVGHNFSDKWYAEAVYTRNDFQGYLGERQGKDYVNTADANDGLRGYEWLPKEQNNIKALVNFTGDHFKAFYKFGFFNELTNKYANNVRLNPNNATQTYNPTASDAIFRSERMTHNLNFTGQIAQQINFNVSASYQEQKRNVENYTYYIDSDSKEPIDRYDYNTRKGFFSRGTLSHFFDNPNFDLEVGYAITNDKGSASGLSSQNASGDTQHNTLNSYSGFLSAEIQATKRLSLRPGARLIASSMFSPEYAFSFSGKYQFNNGYQLRAIIGSAPKIPTFEQLYFYMVDSNHNVQGNQNLNPEYGKSIFVHFKKTFHNSNYTWHYTPKLSAWYLDVDDKIDLIIVDESPLSYQYNNINTFRTWGVSFRNEFRYQQFSAGLGVSVSGESKQFSVEEVTNDDYLYSVQATANMSYSLTDLGMIFSAYYKYNGPQYQFVNTTDANGNATVVQAKQSDYGWLNASIEKTFFDEQLSLTVGARNLLDVTDIRSESGVGSGTGHSAASSNLMLGYGRSYFVKLMYNLNF